MVLWENFWLKIKGKPLVTLLLAGVCLMFLSSFLTQTTEVQPQSEIQEQKISIPEEQGMERELEEVLRNITGVGQVQVRVSLEAGKESIYAFDQDQDEEVVEETDPQGGKRVTSTRKAKETIVRMKDSSGEKPLVVKEWKAKVKGVIVVAQGADDSRTKERILHAVTAIWALPNYRVVILPMKGQGEI